MNTHKTNKTTSLGNASAFRKAIAPIIANYNFRQLSEKEIEELVLNNNNTAMKKTIFATVLAILLSAMATAQTFVGTLTTNGYNKNDVTVKITAKTAGQATISMYNAKFSRWMPVKVDLDITPVKIDENQRLSANNVVPTSNGKRYENRTVHQLSGAIGGNSLTFKCLMGDKNVSFSGKRKSK